MRTSVALAACLVLAALGAHAPDAEAAARPKAAEAKPKKPAKPTFEPTSAFERQQVEGWPVLVHKKVLAKKDLWERTLRQLQVQLYNITRMVPAKAVERLRQVRIWVEENPKVRCMCYHPSRRWLEGHDFNPEKAKSVELGGPETFCDWTRHQPWMVLHELAHGYHHQVIGYNHPGVRAAYEKAKKAGSYESVLYLGGNKKKAYAMNNDQEYFAELTEAWFGTNDFYPFVRAEVLKHDPDMAKVLKEVWENPPEAKKK
jgi:hypothetical protein